MKRLAITIGLAAALVACAPTQGAKPVLYKANSGEILATIAQIAPSVQPTKLSNYFSVTAVTPTYVTLSAQPVLGFQIVNALAGSATNSGTVTVTFTALENQGVTSLSSSLSDNRNIEFVNRVYAELDKKFNRIPN